MMEPTILRTLQRILNSATSRNSIIVAVFLALIVVRYRLSAETNGVHIAGKIHTDKPVVAVAWSPDGTKIATISYSGEIDLWHPDGKLLRHLGRIPGPTTSHDLGFVDHGRYLVTPPNALIPGMDVLSPGPEPIQVSPPGREKEALAVWEVETGRVVRHVEGPALTLGHVIESPGRYAVSPDGSMVALQPTLETRLTIYETHEWKIIQMIEAPRWHRSGDVMVPYNFVFSPNSLRIAICGDDEIISYRLRRSDEPADSSAVEAIHYPFPGSSNPLFSPDNSLFATDGAMWSEVSHSPYNPTQSPYRIRFWRLSDQTLSGDYPERFEVVRQATWSADGEILAVSAGQAIRLYMPHQPRTPPRIIKKEEAMALAFSPKESLLAAAIGNEVLIMDIKL